MKENGKMMKRIRIYVGMLTLFGFSQFGLVSLALAKHRAVEFHFASNPAEATVNQPRLMSNGNGELEENDEGPVEKTSEPKMQRVKHGNAVGHDQQELIAQASFRVKQFSSQLKTELMAAIQFGGLNEGVEVCHSKAPKIADNLSTDGWILARTSLKTRNEKNKPDKWETDTLHQFNTRFKQGEEVANLVTIVLDEKRFRLMKAIPMDHLCLSCHGSSIDASLQETIQKYYPNDSATGFTLEDLRGAFSLQKDLSE